MTESRLKVMEILESYPLKKRQINQLRFELGHPPLIGEKEIIDSLSFGSSMQGEISRTNGYISNKTMAIALQYQDVLQRMNTETLNGIMQELHTLEAEIARIEYYVSLLDELKASVIRFLYFDQLTWAETENKMSISKRSLLNYRKEAINEIVTMYLFLAGVKEKDI